MISMRDTSLLHSFRQQAFACALAISPFLPLNAAAEEPSLASQRVDQLEKGMGACQTALVRPGTRKEIDGGVESQIKGVSCGARNVRGRVTPTKQFDITVVYHQDMPSALLGMPYVEQFQTASVSLMTSDGTSFNAYADVTFSGIEAGGKFLEHRDVTLVSNNQTIYEADVTADGDFASRKPVGPSIFVPGTVHVERQDFDTQQIAIGDIPPPDRAGLQKLLALALKLKPLGLKP